MVDPEGRNSNDMPFITEATIDLKKDYTKTEMGIVPVTYSSSVGTTFSTAQTATTVKAGLFLLPAAVTGDLKIVVTLNDGLSLNFPLTGFNQEFVSGTLYTSNIDLKDVEEPEPEPDPNFVIVDGVLTAYLGAGGEITIPANATSILSGANATTGVFYNNTSITKIDLNNVTEVGNNAFKGCSNLTDVNAPNLEVVKDEGFHGCSKLVDIYAPKLRSLAAHAFRACSALKTMDASKVTELTGSNIFYQCISLESIDLSSFEGNIPFQAFMQCSKLTTVIAPKVTSVGGTDQAGSSRGQVFANCDALLTLDFPSATILSWRSINNATITSLNIPKVTILRLQALAYCTALRRVSLPSVVEIESGVFNTITDMVIDLSQATGLTTVHASCMPDVAGIRVYVATEEIKTLFPAYSNVTITVGAPPQP
jgi:hypothetical protein